MLSDYNRLIKRHPRAFTGTRSLARTALLWLSQGANVYEGSSIPLTDFTREIAAEGVGALEADPTLAREQADAGNARLAPARAVEESGGVGGHQRVEPPIGSGSGCCASCGCSLPA